VILREGNKLFFDKRDGGPFDTVTVNENASDPPQDPAPPNPNNPNEKSAVPEVLSINSATSLSLEATYINQNFGFQSVIESTPPPAVDFAHANPFYGSEETEPLASCGYRYRVFDLGITEDEDVKICVRTEVDAYSPGQGNPREGHGLVTIRALNEFDPRAQGAGGAPDWRSKLDSQRGAVVATEMKNNSCKLAKWTVQSVLAGADLMKIGYVDTILSRLTGLRTLFYHDFHQLFHQVHLSCKSPRQHTPCYLKYRVNAPYRLCSPTQCLANKWMGDCPNRH
jgi:translation initiation factor 3 subunit D